MKRDRFIMNARFLTRRPKKYKVYQFSWDWWRNGYGPSYTLVEKTPVKQYSYLKRIVRAVDLEKSINGYRKREYKFFPRVNSYNNGSYKSVYKTATKNPLACRNSF